MTMRLLVMKMMRLLVMYDLPLVAPVRWPRAIYPRQPPCLTYIVHTVQVWYWYSRLYMVFWVLETKTKLKPVIQFKSDTELLIHNVLDSRNQTKPRCQTHVIVHTPSSDAYLIQSSGVWFNRQRSPRRSLLLFIGYLYRSSIFFTTQMTYIEQPGRYHRCWCSSPHTVVMVC